MGGAKLTCRLEGGHKMEKRPLSLTMFILLVLIAIATALNSHIALAGELKMIRGQTVYVPVYSHIIIGERERGTVNFDLSINLSIRNTDPKNPITIISADYYDSNGVVVKKFVTNPVTLKPMASTYFFIAQWDKSGGWGANYIVEWKSEKEVNEPIIESVTFGSRGTHSISFVSQGRVINENVP
jgi:hypothetical protein